MWWIYEMLENSETHCLYSYARESRVLDGLLFYDKSAGIAKVEKPCTNDVEDPFSIKAAENKFSYIVAEGFPVHRQVACG